MTRMEVRAFLERVLTFIGKNAPAHEIGVVVIVHDGGEVCEMASNLQDPSARAVVDLVSHQLAEKARLS